jgi:DivIVA domain-containing protein
MTPEDIRSQRFAVRLVRGLSPEEVTAFLEDVAEAFDNVQKANASLASRVEMLEGAAQALAAHDTLPAQGIDLLRVAAVREVEALLHDAQAEAQARLATAKEREAEMLRDAEAAKARMEQEAETLVREASARAASLIAESKEQATALRAEIDRLTQSHGELVDSIRATLDRYHQWLTTIDLRGRARGRRETLERADDHLDGVAAPDEAA